MVCFSAVLCLVTWLWLHPEKVHNLLVLIIIGDIIVTISLSIQHKRVGVLILAYDYDLVLVCLLTKMSHFSVVFFVSQQIVKIL